MISETLGLFVNTLTADGKYSVCNKENLPQPVQMESCKTQKVFSESFTAFLKSTSNFEHFLKKYEPHS